MRIIPNHHTVEDIICLVLQFCSIRTKKDKRGVGWREDNNNQNIIYCCKFLEWLPVIPVIEMICLSVMIQSLLNLLLTYLSASFPDSLFHGTYTIVTPINSLLINCSLKSYFFAALFVPLPRMHTPVSYAWPLPADHFLAEGYNLSDLHSLD